MKNKKEVINFCINKEPFLDSPCDIFYKNNKYIGCPFDGRLVFGKLISSSHCDNYCIKNTLDNNPVIKSFILNRYLSKYKNKKYKKIINKQPPSIISEKEKNEIKYQLNSFLPKQKLYYVKTIDSLKTDIVNTAIQKQLITLYGNNRIAFPEKILQLLVSILKEKDNSCLISFTSNKRYIIWKDNKYINSFSLNEVSVALSLYKDPSNCKLMFMCIIEKGNNLDIVTFRNPISFRFIADEKTIDIYNQCKKIKERYAVPSEIEQKYCNFSPHPFDNSLCSKCLVKEFCDGNCPYKQNFI